MIPKNEAGTRELFATSARRYGFEITAAQGGYPDWILNGNIRAEAEFLSSNFIEHGHDPSLCDLVICWRCDHSLPIPILELQTGALYMPGSYWQPRADRIGLIVTYHARLQAWASSERGVSERERRQAALETDRVIAGTNTELSLAIACDEPPPLPEGLLQAVTVSSLADAVAADLLPESLAYAIEAGWGEGEDS